MAKVKITGHASGSGVFTITAPNSNTDRTITLPDASVTLGTDATKLPLAGGALTGAVTTNSTFDGRDVAADGVLATNALPKAGGTLTGVLNVNNKLNIQEASTTVTNLGTHTTRVVGAGYGGRQLFIGNSDSAAINKGGVIEFGGKYTGNASTEWSQIGGVKENGTDGNYAGYLKFATRANGAGIVEHMRITSDGRGVSHFTARAWARIDQTGNLQGPMVHNCSSLTDNGTGDSTVNFTNAIGSTLYCVVTGNAAEADWGERVNPTTTASASVRLQNVQEDGTFHDSSRIHCAIFMSQE